MAKPFISLFDVTPNTIDRGDKVVFRWAVSNAVTRTLTTKGSIPPVGSWTFYPASTKTYTLTATNSEGTSEKYQTVTVIQPPAPPPEPPEPPPEPPLPPTPEDCPDFWTDPVGAVTCWIIKSIEATLGLVSGGFLAFITYLQQWSAAFTTDFWLFLQDPIESIRMWMSDVFVSIGELTNQISTGISDWWQQGIIDVGIMITSATTGFSSWIDDRFTGINDWWADAQAVWGTWWDDRLTDLENWRHDFQINVNKWYNSNIQPIINAIGSKLEDAAAWIAGFPALIGQWWQDRLIEVGVWIVEATAASNEWIAGFSGLIGDWWLDRVTEIGIWLADRTNEFNYWVENTLPGIIEEMIKLPEWLVAPFGAIGNFAKLMYEFFTGTYEEEQQIIDTKRNYKEQTDRVKEILGRP